MKNIAIIGAGSWGTALASSLARMNHRVILWAYEPEVVESIRTRHENKLFMPGYKLPESVGATSEMRQALLGAEIVLTVVPSHVCRTVYEQMLPNLHPQMVFVSATKGIDAERRLRMSEIIHGAVGKRFSPRLTVLSGPSFAQEVAHDDPTAVGHSLRGPRGGPIGPAGIFIADAATLYLK